MLVFQYLYYIGRETDERWGFPIAYSRGKLLTALIMCQFFLLAAIDSFADRVVFGSPFSKQTDIFELIALLSVGFVLIYINHRMLGNNDRIRKYKRIFDAWDEKKRFRWKILSISIGLALIAACFLTIEVTHHGLDFQKWK